MVALWNRADHYIFILLFVLLSSFFFFLAKSQPSQSVCLPYLHAWCGLSTNLRCRSETCCTRLAEIQDAKMSPKSPSGHHRATLSGYIFATKARIDNQKKNIKQQYVPRCAHNMVNCGPLAPVIGLLVWGTPTNFNGFRVLAALLHGSQVVSVSQTLRR